MGAVEINPTNFVVDRITDESDGNYAPGDLSLREAMTLANILAASADSRSARMSDSVSKPIDSRTVVVILSDGLDRGDTDRLRDAMRRIRARARKVIWLNPLLHDPRYRPEARGMEAALPFVDHFGAAHAAASLERLLPLLVA